MTAKQISSLRFASHLRKIPDYGFRLAERILDPGGSLKTWKRFAGTGGLINFFCVLNSGRLFLAQRFFLA
jgi:hypothetical protein